MCTYTSTHICPSWHIYTYIHTYTYIHKAMRPGRAVYARCGMPSGAGGHRGPHPFCTRLVKPGGGVCSRWGQRWPFPDVLVDEGAATPHGRRVAHARRHQTHLAATQPPPWNERGLRIPHGRRHRPLAPVATRAGSGAREDRSFAPRRRRRHDDRDPSEDSELEAGETFDFARAFHTLRRVRVQW